MATLNRYWAGNLIKFTATFLNMDTLEPIDPTAVEFAYRVGGGTPTRYLYGTDVALVRVGAGIYQIQIDSSNQVGQWSYIWASHGTGQATLSRAIIVDAPAIVPSF